MQTHKFFTVLPLKRNESNMPSINKEQSPQEYIYSEINKEKVDRFDIKVPLNI